MTDEIDERRWERMLRQIAIFQTTGETDLDPEDFHLDFVEGGAGEEIEASGEDTGRLD